MPEEQLAKKSRLASQTIYEIIAREGNEELSRPLSSLGWSGFAAGICICFSVFTQAYLARHLPDTSGFEIIEKMGYVAGFMIVIMARLQLFTENTITVILPLLDKISHRNIMRTLKLWGVVFATNMLGTLAVAFVITKMNLADPAFMESLLAISMHAVDQNTYDIFVSGIPAGFLIAVMVWMMPSAKGSEPIIIFIMIFLISLGGYSHVVAGSFEAFLVWINGMTSLQGSLTYILAAGAGNIIGGTGIFTLLAYAQVKDEI
jgi:formate/nitrite transporter FocA (FNT family)